MVPGARVIVHPCGRGDYRPEPWIDDARPAVFARADRKRKQVTVAAEPPAESPAQPGEAFLPAAKQEVCAAERACGDDYPPRPHRLQRAAFAVVEVTDDVAAVAALDALRLAEDAHVGARAELREIGEVERVFGAEVAAGIAFAHEPASEAVGAESVATAVVKLLTFLTVPRERDREVREERSESSRSHAVGERLRLRRRPKLGRVLGRTEHLLHGLVVRLEIVVRHRPGLAAGHRPREPGAGLAQQDVRVDQRAAAQPARDQCCGPLERPDVVEPVQAGVGGPEVALRRGDPAREAAGWVLTPALEQADRYTRL